MSINGQDEYEPTGRVRTGRTSINGQDEYESTGRFREEKGADVALSSRALEAVD